MGRLPFAREVRQAWTRVGAARLQCRSGFSSWGARGYARGARAWQIPRWRSPLTPRSPGALWWRRPAKRSFCTKSSQASRRHIDGLVKSRWTPKASKILSRASKQAGQKSTRWQPSDRLRKLNPSKQAANVGTHVKGDKAVSYWLFSCAALVAGMVLLGGLTRLTRSGLSMTSWRLQGSMPPGSEEEWEAEFERYRQYPEYKRLNKGMSLSEFKFIYFMEWGHRMAGRLIGLVFLFPAIYFWFRGRISHQGKERLVAAFGIGCCQAYIGWWMVKSGLTEPDFTHQEPKVSPVRLMFHFSTAMAIFSLLFFSALREHPNQLHVKARSIYGDVWTWQVPRRLRLGAALLTILAGTTLMSGSLVAGNRAGLVYNEFPYMGKGLVPEDYWLPHFKPGMDNLLYNSACVQFNHRVLGMSTVAATGYFWYLCNKSPVFGIGRAVPRLVKKSAAGLFHISLLQMTLGILTLLWLVPTDVAALHQMGAMTLFTGCLWMLHLLCWRNYSHSATLASTKWMKKLSSAKQGAALQRMKHRPKPFWSPLSSAVGIDKEAEIKQAQVAMMEQGMFASVYGDTMTEEEAMAKADKLKTRFFYLHSRGMQVPDHIYETMLLASQRSPRHLIQEVDWKEVAKCEESFLGQLRKDGVTLADVPNRYEQFGDFSDLQEDAVIPEYLQPLVEEMATQSTYLVRPADSETPAVVPDWPQDHAVPLAPEWDADDLHRMFLIYPPHLTAGDLVNFADPEQCNTVGFWQDMWDSEGAEMKEAEKDGEEGEASDAPRTVSVLSKINRELFDVLSPDVQSYILERTEACPWKAYLLPEWSVAPPRQLEDSLDAQEFLERRASQARQALDDELYDEVKESILKDGAQSEVKDK